MPTSDLPQRAQVVIVGGGAVGCSVAYHLAKLGWTDVVLIEQGQLSCGTTWHAAGVVGQLRTHPSLTRLMIYSSGLYAGLEAEVGLGTGWNQCGALWVAASAARMTQLRRTVDLARAQGLEAHDISVAEAGARWPLMRTEDLVGAIWLPNDAKANPADLTQALARGARHRGVRIFERTRALGWVVDRDRVTSVATDRGDIECEYVVNCGGQWAKALGEQVGVTVPLQPAEHYYIVTEPIDGLDRTAPTLRDPDGYTYFKEEVRGLLMGGFEPDAKPWVGSDEIPEPFEFQLLPEDWDQFDILMRNAVHRVPAMESAGVKKFYNGPESFTPDHNFIMGLAPGLDNYFVLAGFNSSGIAFAGGAGNALAKWIVAGEPDLDLGPVDIRRFAPMQGNKRWLRGRVKEIVGLHFAMAWPNREPQSARGVRRSAVHHLLEAQGACFGTRMGWERANWFAPAGTKPVVEYGWGRQNWFGHSAAEHRAAREGVALFDQTSFAKIAVRGADAEAALQFLCSNDVAVRPGRTVYTALLNDRGGYEADVTVTRIRWNEYLLMTSSAQGIHDLDLLRRGVPSSLRVEFFDVTSSYAVLSVMGPQSRALLGGLSSDDFSAAAFPFGHSREVDLGGLTVRATRLTYVGELGWELYIPSEVAVAAFERLTDPGNPITPKPGGYYAIESLRLEKGYRAFGRELGPDTSPVEAGLTFACKLDTAIAFRGREAVERHKADGAARRLVSLVVSDPDAYAWGGELLLRDGEPSGFASSAAYGHTLGRTVLLGYLERRDGGKADRDWLGRGRYQVAIGGQCYDASVWLRSPYDPAGARIRA